MVGDGEKGKGEEEIIDGQIHTGQLLALWNISEFSCGTVPFYSGKISGKEWDTSLTSFRYIKKVTFKKGTELHLDV